MKTRVIKIPVYEGTLIIHLADDLKEIEEKYSLSDTSDYDAFFYKKDENYIMAFNKESIKKPHIVAHECLHFVNQLFFDHGIKLDPENDEPQCYWLGWVIKKVNNIIK